MNNEFVKYIFVSHSSKDWKKVRLIRNYLEESDFLSIVVPYEMYGTRAYG